MTAEELDAIINGVVKALMPQLRELFSGVAANTARLDDLIDQIRGLVNVVDQKAGKRATGTVVDIRTRKAVAK